MADRLQRSRLRAVRNRTETISPEEFLTSISAQREGGNVSSREQMDVKSRKNQQQTQEADELRASRERLTHRANATPALGASLADGTDVKDGTSVSFPSLCGGGPLSISCITNSPVQNQSIFWLSRDSNRRPFCCEATMPPTEPPH
ncbi:hypothetical protein ROHU_031208 [Labeo rohita]|uniref:Uncharacterized protein n=1 Tax=Labeo rohita TaxID=84645 RepID=A0A498LN16_LABRO|nr:hypothetical protein ROHU_031208 [Labeo rohita]